MNDPRLLRAILVPRNLADALQAPRGVGPTAWPKAKNTQVRRRFLLLGQTLDGMLAYDVRRAVQAMGHVPEWKAAKDIELVGTGATAPIAILAALFEPKVDGVELGKPIVTFEGGPAFWNLSRELGMPQLAALLEPRKLFIAEDKSEVWRWTIDLGKMLVPDREWPTFNLGIPPVQRVTF